MLSNTLGLRTYIAKHGKDPALAKPAIELINDFALKFKGGDYPLMCEAQIEPMKPEIGRIFGELFGKERADIMYVGVDDMEKGGLDKQLEIYQLVYQSPLSRWLPVRTYEKKDLERRAGPGLKELVKLSLGTHRLRPILDRAFGHDFSKILKGNIIAVWYCYCGALLDGDMVVAARYGAMSTFITKTLPVGRVDGDPPSWCFFVDANDPKKVIV